MIQETLYISAGKVYAKKNGKMVKIGDGIRIEERTHKQGGGGYFVWDESKDDSAEELLNNFPELK